MYIRQSKVRSKVLDLTDVTEVPKFLVIFVVPEVLMWYRWFLAWLFFLFMVSCFLSLYIVSCVHIQLPFLPGSVLSLHVPCSHSMLHALALCSMLSLYTLALCSHSVFPALAPCSTLSLCASSSRSMLHTLAPYSLPKLTSAPHFRSSDLSS